MARFEKGMKLDGTLKAFLDEKRRKKKRERTVTNYEQDLRFFSDFMLAKGYTHWNEIERQDVKDYIDRINELKWAEASKLKRLRALKAFFNWIDSDPDCTEQKMSGFGKVIGTVKKAPRREWIPSAAEVNQFLTAFNKTTRSGLRDHTMTMLLLDCGIRSGEMTHLKMEHLKLDEKVLLVPREGKTGPRLVWITDDMVRHVRRWLNVREDFAKCDYLFLVDEGDRKLTVDHVSKMFAHYRRRAAVSTTPGRAITPHVLRHFFATNWIREGGDLATLKQQTGHASLETVQVYLHLAGDKRVAQVCERVSAIKVVMSAGDKRKGGRQRTAIV